MADVQIIKLSSGEDIIGSVTEVTLEAGRMIQIEKPCYIMMRPKPENENEFVLGLTPYAPYAKGHLVPIMPAHVVSVFTPTTDLLNAYNQRYGSGLVVPDDNIAKAPPKQIITGQIMYEYKATIRRVVDGDTVDVDIDLGFGVWLKDERVRIMGIDTPESRTRDKVEKKFGKAAAARLKSLLGKTAVLKTRVARDGQDMKGKFGRILGDFEVYYAAEDRYCLAGEILIKEGHAVMYNGQSKDDVQAAHLENRKLLIAEGVVSL